MGADDKIRNAAEDVAGKVKEGVGKLTDNPKLEAEGQADQAAAGVKKAAEKVADKVQDVADKAKNALD